MKILVVVWLVALSAAVGFDEWQDRQQSASVARQLTTVRQNIRDAAAELHEAQAAQADATSAALDDLEERQTVGTVDANLGAESVDALERRLATLEREVGAYTTPGSEPIASEVSDLAGQVEDLQRCIRTLTSSSGDDVSRYLPPMASGCP